MKPSGDRDVDSAGVYFLSVEDFEARTGPGPEVHKRGQPSDPASQTGPDDARPPADSDPAEPAGIP